MKEFKKTNIKKTTISEKVSKLFGGFWFKIIKKPVGDFLFNNFKKPYLERKAKKDAIKQAENKIREDAKHVQMIKDNFSKTFGNHDAALELFKQIPFGQTNQKYLNEKLIEGRKILMSASYTNLSYVPEVVEIHNENLNPQAPSIIEILKNDSTYVGMQLKEQLRLANLKNGNSIREEHPTYFDPFNQTSKKPYGIQGGKKLPLYRDVKPEETNGEISLAGIRDLDDKRSSETFSEFMKFLKEAKNKL